VPKDATPIRLRKFLRFIAGIQILTAIKDKE
jgi:hypothetical protein